MTDALSQVRAEDAALRQVALGRLKKQSTGGTGDLDPRRFRRRHRPPTPAADE